MKNLYLLMLVLAGITFNAQIVNIPDANFKAKLLSSTTLNGVAGNYNTGFIKIDANNDGEIQLSEIANVQHLNLTGANIYNLEGIKSFTNLEFLVAQNNHLSTVDISNMISLEHAVFNSNDITSINIDNCISLTHLRLEGNNFTTLTLASPYLKNLFLEYSNSLQSINVNGCTALEELRISNSNITNINLTTLTALKTIYLSNNHLIHSVDLRNNINCEVVGIINNNNLQNLFIKNGKNNFLNNNNNVTAIIANSNLSYVCMDDFEIADNDISPVPSVINSYCTFAPGGTYYTIEGNTKFDIGSNGCDVADPIKPLQKFNMSNGSLNQNFFGNQSGNYELNVTSGMYTIVPILENPTYFNISPASFTASFPLQTSPLNQNFCVTANGVHNDLEVSIIPITNAAPGFNAKYKIIYKNKGTTTQSGSVSFNYNENISDFVTSSVAPSSQSSGLLNFNFINLLPFETKEILVTIHLNTPTQTPPLNGGDILHYTSQITGLTDETPSDNTFNLNQTVVNSFDPNDKTCLQGTSIAQSKVGDYVHYLIRFENTGTANAQNIVVKDIIDTNKFDISSFVALNGSHNFTTRITNTNTVEFIFENIQLPFDDANNDGYVSFKIKTKSTLTVGDSFSNSAGIYFDYNAPIITNTYTTSVTESLSTIETAKDETIAVYPNPVQDIVNFRSKEKVLKLEVYDISGRIVSSLPVINQQADLSSLRKGNFMVKIILKDKFYTKKIIKK